MPLRHRFHGTSPSLTRTVGHGLRSHLRNPISGTDGRNVGSKGMPSPQDVVGQARHGESVVGWKLDRGQREELLALYPPKYAKVVADHVTLKPKVAADTPLPDPPEAQLVGRADDGQGVEAMVVSLDGGTDRAGGGTYHITWSLGPGRRAVESNDVLSEGHWERFAQPISLRLDPAHFR